MGETFYEYMRNLLGEDRDKILVEVGSDVQLKLATSLAPYCQRIYSVNFKIDHDRMQGWYDLAKDMGGATNLELRSGNITNLANLVDRADIIIAQNLLVAANDTDIALMWKYRRREIECTEEAWHDLVGRFNQAEEQAYKSFFQVAKPGKIITFRRPDPEKSLLKVLSKINVSEKSITKRELTTPQNDVWEAYIIENM
jgi:hypothetical protein